MLAANIGVVQTVFQTAADGRRLTGDELSGKVDWKEDGLPGFRDMMRNFLLQMESI